MKKIEKIMEQVQKDKERLSKEYNVSLSSIIWMDNGSYIVICNDGTERIVF